MEIDCVSKVFFFLDIHSWLHKNIYTQGTFITIAKSQTLQECHPNQYNTLGVELESSITVYQLWLNIEIWLAIAARLLGRASLYNILVARPGLSGPI